MTNDLLLSKIHLIRLAVDRSLKNCTLSMDYDTYNELLEFQRELEIDQATGDSP